MCDEILRRLRMTICNDNRPAINQDKTISLRRDKSRLYELRQGPTPPENDRT